MAAQAEIKTLVSLARSVKGSGRGNNAERLELVGAAIDSLVSLATPRHYGAGAERICLPISPPQATTHSRTLEAGLRVLVQHSEQNLVSAGRKRGLVSRTGTVAQVDLSNGRVSVVLDCDGDAHGSWENIQNVRLLGGGTEQHTATLNSLLACAERELESFAQIPKRRKASLGKESSSSDDTSTNMSDVEGPVKPKAGSTKGKNISTQDRWTEEEDAILTQGVAELGYKAWSLICRRLDGRKPKQCRERWMMSLDPSIVRGPWSPDEDRLLMESHERLGNAWAKIKQSFPNRSPNQLKTRAQTLLRCKKKDEQIQWSAKHQNRLVQLVTEYDSLEAVRRHLPRELKGASTQALVKHCPELARKFPDFHMQDQRKP